MIGDSFDATHHESMRNWRYRLAYYRLHPYYVLVVWWIRFKSAVDRLLDLDEEME